MMRYSLIALLFNILVVSCAAQQKVKPSASSDAGQVDNALLWSVSKKGKEVGYLFGTIHLIPEGDFFFTQPMEEAFSTCDHLVLELDLSELESDMTNVFGLMDLLSMDGGVRLSDLLTPEDYALVDARFQELGLPLMILEGFKPAFLDMMLQVDPGDINGAYRFYEFELVNRAKEQGMTTSGLENMEDQISIFDSIPYENQANMLITNLKSRSNLSDELDKIIQLYKNQDIQKMYESFADDESPLASYQNLLITDRNKNWMNHLDAAYSGKTAFVAVGAGHLAGEHGLVNLLRKKGYDLAPVEIF